MNYADKKSNQITILKPTQNILLTKGWLMILQITK